MNDIGVPLHTVSVESALVSGKVAVGVCPEIPLKGVSFLMGNDLAGGKVLVTPDVTPVSVRQFPDALAQGYPRSVQLAL